VKSKLGLGVNMKQVDVLLINRQTGERTVVEVCTSGPPQKELKNIVQDLAEDTGISKVVVLVTDSGMKRKLESLIKEEAELAPLLDRISVHLIGEFFD
jgi:hypothetical protein